MRSLEIRLPASRLAYEDALREVISSNEWDVSADDIRLLKELLDAIIAAKATA